MSSIILQEWTRFGLSKFQITFLIQWLLTKSQQIIRSHKHSSSRTSELHGKITAIVTTFIFTCQGKSSSWICWHAGHFPASSWTYPLYLFPAKILIQVESSLPARLNLALLLLPIADSSKQPQPPNTVNKPPLLPEPTGKAKLTFLRNCKAPALVFLCNALHWVCLSKCLCFGLCKTRAGQWGMSQLVHYLLLAGSSSTKSTARIMISCFLWKSTPVEFCFPCDLTI